MKTFVFTDIVQSVDLKGHMVGRSDAERDAAFVDTVLTPHREHIEIGLADAGGRVVSTAGDGHFLAFDNPIRAAEWAIDVQRRHRDRPIATPRDAEVQVRIGLHVGFPQADPDDSHNFVGKAVDYAARLADLATAGQLLVSTAALGLIRDAGLEGIAFHTHGDHPLRGIGAVEVHELLYDGNEPRPLRTTKTDANAPSSAEALTDVLPVENSANEQDQREWTVLPPTMGLTEFARQKSDSPSANLADGSSGAAVKPTPAMKLGNYHIGDLIGAGGMGNVYRAKHSQFERTRAIKIIKPHFVEAGHEEVIRRFYQEIKAIGGLDHPNIVVAIDSSAPGDATHYLVMEYIDGVSSEQLISRRQRLTVADACEIVRQAAVGLEYIHRQGMVHRDIKPSNLMLTDAEASSLSAGTADELTRRPVVKILDLGLALLVTDDQPRLTRFDHGAMGTAMYMSPEQWVTTSVDIRSDIYSLGCTLYHLLTGRPPYHDSDLKPQRAHERAPTPSAAQDAGAPAELDAVLAKMMAKAPGDRYTRPAEVAEALAPFAAEADLLNLIDHARRGPSARTDAGDHGETRPTGQPTSDTFGPLPPLPGPMPQATPTLSSPAPPSAAPSLLRRVLTPLAIAAAIAAVLWMGFHVRRQQEQLRASREESLKIAAKPAANDLAEEIAARFQTLVEASSNPELITALRPIAAAATEPPADKAAHKRSASKSEREAWRPLQEWLSDRKQQAEQKDSQGKLVSSSWFITDKFGRQIAREAPGKTIGRWYHNRDYFHGQGEPGPDATLTPIAEQHQSAVYRSTSTRLLKVAFSVPVLDEQNEVLGVLAMSVNLGDFKVLDLPRPREVLLVDLRKEVPKQRGLILHHRELDELENPEKPFKLPPELLAQVDTALLDAGRDGSLHNPIIRGYADLLNRPGRGKFVGAFEPVVVRGKNEQRDTGWLVIVQEEITE